MKQTNFNTTKLGQRNFRGFSMIELLIVLAIVAIIAAFAIPNLLSGKRAAHQKLAVAEFHTLKLAQKNYKNDLNMGTFATLAQLRNAAPGGNPLIDPLMVNPDGTGRDNQEWRVEQIENPTTTTFGYKLVPSTGNSSDYSFFMFEDGVVRKTGLTGPYTRNGGEIVE